MALSLGLSDVYRFALLAGIAEERCSVIKTGFNKVIVSKGLAFQTQWQHHRVVRRPGSESLTGTAFWECDLERVTSPL